MKNVEMDEGNEVNIWGRLTRVEGLFTMILSTAKQNQFQSTWSQFIQILTNEDVISHAWHQIWTRKVAERRSRSWCKSIIHIHIPGKQDTDADTGGFSEGHNQFLLVWLL